MTFSFILLFFIVFLALTFFEIYPFITPKKIISNTPLQLEYSQKNNLPLVTEYLQFDKKITNCKERNLSNNISMITSRYCPHCKKALEILIPIIKQQNLENDFKVFDILNRSDLKILNNYGISTSYVPALIVNCNAYIGLKSEEQYIEIISRYNKKTKAPN